MIAAPGRPDGQTLHAPAGFFAIDAHHIYMLDARTNVWLARLQGNAPRLVAFVLGALIVLELAHLAYALIIGPVKSPQPTMTTGGAANPRPVVNVQQVMNAHLFGVPQDAGSRDPDNAPPSSANLLLTGTIATDDPKHGVAIVSEGGGPSKVYSVGDRRAGASLHSVYLDHVILDRNGALETVALPRQLPPGVATGPPIRRGPDPRSAAAVDNIRRMVQQDPSILDQVMRTVPSFDNSAGKLRGFRAFPGKNRQIFSKLGLKSGDLVTAINGTQLDDPQRSQEVFNTIQTSDHVTVTVERGGQKQDITLNVAQLAAQASEELEPSQQNGAAQSAPAPNGGPPGGSAANGAAQAGAGPPSPPPDVQPVQPPPGPQPGTPPGNDNQNPNQ
jgi:general secretion pathway protein C